MSPISDMPIPPSPRISSPVSSVWRGIRFFFSLAQMSPVKRLRKRPRSGGWYCIPCERFWTEKDLVEGKCPDCLRSVNEISEKNYFFRMSKYQSWLIENIEKNERFILPLSRRNEIFGFLRNPLEDLCISRPKN